jgi:hypothetical protein
VAWFAGQLLALELVVAGADAPICIIQPVRDLDGLVTASPATDPYRPDTARNNFRWGWCWFTHAQRFLNAQPSRLVSAAPMTSYIASKHARFTAGWMGPRS